ncbi:MAG TPA: hypothetical protein VMV05_10815 [bacterium]|nr:hypothetical protein [bacterium]
MKHRILISAALILALSPLALLGPGCGSSPATPANPTATPTPTPAIVWSYPEVYRAVNDGPVTSIWAIVQLTVNGQGITTAACTLSGSFGAQAMTYGGPAVHGGVTFAGYQTYNTFTYTPGQPYTITTSVPGATASAAITLPGGISTLADANGAITVGSWSVEGNDDHVAVNQTLPSFSGSLFNTANSGDATSPVTITPSPYVNTTGNAYETIVQAENYFSSAAGVSIAYGGFQAWDVLYHTVSY